MRAGIGFATRAPDGFDAVNQGGNAQALAEVLFRDYFFPFEVTSVLLIIAAIAAMVLAQRRSQRDHAGARSTAHRDDLEASASDAARARPMRPAPIEAGHAMRTPIAYFLMLSAILFALGSAAVLVRRTRCASSWASSCS